MVESFSDTPNPVATEPTAHTSKRVYYVAVLVLIIIIVVGYVLLRRPPATDDRALSGATPTTTAGEVAKTAAGQSWQPAGVVVAGKYADADVVRLADGSYRMYYSIEPEVAGNQLEMYSTTSTDGVTWTQEAGERRKRSTFPDVVQLEDGSWRMYFQNEQVIKSAVSADGLTWTDESGVRIDKVETEVTPDGVSAPTTLRLADGSFLMVYSVALENQRYSQDVPNDKMALFMYATSADGLTWQKQGLLLDSRNDVQKGWADGPDLVQWDDDTIKLFFWGYSGVYESTFTDGTLTTPEVVYAGESEKKTDGIPRAYPENPPGDPTLIKVGDSWFMYYGQHELGIYRAALQ